MHTDNREGGPAWRVPRTHASRINQHLRQEILAAIEPALFGDPWAAHGIVARFEERFAAQMGYRHVSGVQSGSAGLRLALLACGLRPGDEVITVANSDIATTAAISQCGGRPVLCDIQPSDYNMDPAAVESLIGPRTAGLLPVDMYGHPADVRTLRQIADRHGLFIVEDAAIAAGARDHGQPVGAFADMVVFSCAPFKLLEGLSYGGLVATARAELHRQVELLKGFGLQPGIPKALPSTYAHIAEGYNLALPPVEAAVLEVKLPHLPRWVAQRRQVAHWYAQGLANAPGITLPQPRPTTEPAFREYTIQVAYGRDRAYRRLQVQGVQAALHYVPPVHQQPLYRDQPLRGADRLPVTETLSPTTLCLPVDPEITEADAEFVVATLLAALAEG
ncbi:MAG: DegT/DnrJ/EryC1/StrS family aminotransferase [Chloroflexi bacterium]|nr:DegT/DnrJ/EryC1/StrS family aminotransferase [Chloroflexota bacterium]